MVLLLLISKLAPCFYCNRYFWSHAIYHLEVMLLHCRRTFTALQLRHNGSIRVWDSDIYWECNDLSKVHSSSVEYSVVKMQQKSGVVAQSNVDSQCFQCSGFHWSYYYLFVGETYCPIYGHAFKSSEVKVVVHDSGWDRLFVTRMAKCELFIKIGEDSK